MSQTKPKKAKMDGIIFSLDTERVGLYGEDFAVGVTIQDDDGKELESLLMRVRTTTSLLSCGL